MALQALEVVYVTGAPSFVVEMNTFYRVDTSAGTVNANLPAVANTNSSDWVIIKNISGDNPVNINPAPGEQINASSSQHTVSGNNQSLQYMPNTPEGYGAGWVSW